MTPTARRTDAVQPLSFIEPPVSAAAIQFRSRRPIGVPPCFVCSVSASLLPAAYLTLNPRPGRSGGCVLRGPGDRNAQAVGALLRGLVFQL